jgi:TonB family protein
MLKIVYGFAAAALIAHPLAAKPSPQQLQQLSEVVFQNYPGRALAAGEQGPVYFIVRVDDKAHPTSCEVTHSSGFPQLDAETCDLIVQHATFKSLIGADGRLTKSLHEGVVNWRIPGTPQPPINPIPVTAASAPEKQICKRTPRAGTLAGFNRQCMTQREWDLALRQTRDQWEQYQGSYGSTSDPGMVPGPIGSRTGSPDGPPK